MDVLVGCGIRRMAVSKEGCSVNGDETGPCAGCGRDHSPGHPVTWNPLTGDYLCESCRDSQADAEHGATRRANLAARRETGETP